MSPSRAFGVSQSSANLPSPLLIYDWRLIEQPLRFFRDIVDAVDGTLLYSIKAQPFAGLLTRISPWVNGFAVSSLFEARLVQASFETPPEIHLTSPGIRGEEIDELASICSHINFNSLGQFERLAAKIHGSAQPGLRINHGISSIGDDRYNPCRKPSKLGVPVEELKDFASAHPNLIQRLKGLHFHTHFLEADAKPLGQALLSIEDALGDFLKDLEWINLGGGYAPQNEADVLAFQDVLKRFKERFKGTIILEPGNAIIGRAGSLQTQVIDLFERDGATIAVLDTGVHHLPEVFEYQKAPSVKEADPQGIFQVLLAGSTCLAGDLFGTYHFKQPLLLGDTLTLENVGAYSLVKANRFNGHDLPALAIRGTSGTIELLKTFGYSDYLRQWGYSSSI
jgi:carboxynorspermidine decarboxylase